MKKVFAGVFADGRKIYTLSLAPGKSVYGEWRSTVHGLEYREWDPHHSKLGAAVARGLKRFPIQPGDRVLYLGAAQGTTPSHIADVVGSEGLVFCVEFAPRAFEKLMPVCEARENMLPILADASDPDKYAELVGKVDVLYQDVAQPNQADILLRNCALLKKGGLAVIAIKSRSVDVTEAPSKVFEKELATVRAAGLEQLEAVRLEPFESDHLLAIFRKRVS